MPIPDVKIIIRGIDRFSNKIGKPLKMLNKLGKSLSKAGRTMTIGFTLPIALLGAQTLKTAGEFELSMNRVQNITQATKSEFVDLQKLARELGATTVFSASEAADAMGFLAMAGLSTDKVISALPSTLHLAAAGQLDLAESADKLSNILTQYRMQADQAAFTTDRLVFAAQNANTDISQLAEALVYSGTVARGMNVPFEETAAFLGMLGNAGVQASMAGTTLRGVLANLANPAGNAIDVLNKLKIRRSDMQDSAGNVSSLIKVVEALEKAGASSGDMMAIFGKRAGPGMIGVVSQGSKALRDFTKDIANSAGTAQRAAEVMNKGLLGQLKALKSAFQELQLAIADAGILEFATNMVTKLAAFTRKVGKLNPALLKWGVILVSVVAAIFPLIWALGATMSALSAILPLLSLLTLAIKGVAAAFIFFSANPIGMVITGIALLIAGIVLLVKNWDWVVEKFKDGWSFITKHWKQAVNIILVAMGPLGAGLLAIVNNLDRIKEGLKGVGRFILPKGLETKFGLSPSADTEVPQVGQLRQEFFQRSVQTNEFKGTLDIRNAPPGSSVSVEKGDMDLNVDSGLIAVGGTF